MNKALFGRSDGQILLPLQSRREHRLERYVEGAESSVLAVLDQFLNNRSDTGLYLCAGLGQGKTHLLVGLAEQHGYPAAHYLSLAQVGMMAPEGVLDGLAEHRLLCLDDVDAVAGDSQWEEQLFHLFNRSQQLGNQVIWSARHLPAKSGFGLPDLVSRFAWGVVFVLPELSDSQKRDVLLARANERGIALSDEVLHYLFSRSQRDMSALMSVLDRLDHESLMAKRGITIPFIKKIMRW